MNFNSNDLDAISEYAYQLKLLGMLQSAGNYDYLVAWIKSPSFNNGDYLPPHPAGNNTIDEYSNNCPIPYYDPCEYRACSDIDKAIMLLKYIATHIDNLKAYIDNDLEQTAILSYKNYTTNIIESLGGTVEPDEPDIPDEPDTPFSLINAISDTDNVVMYWGLECSHVNNVSAILNSAVTVTAVKNNDDFCGTIINSSAMLANNSRILSYTMPLNLINIITVDTSGV